MPGVSRQNLARAYRAMAADEEREREAIDWTETLTDDIADEPGTGRVG